MIRNFLIVLHLIFFPLVSMAVTLQQDINALLKLAREAEKDRREALALERYLEVARIAPTRLEAICKTSELYCMLGRRQATDKNRREYYLKGLEWARKAYALDPRHAETNFVMSFAMGRLALIASGEEKINAVRDIKRFAERTIEFDPDNFKGYHVLAKWHYEVSSLSALERWLVRIAFGALPPASFATAIQQYEKSKKLNPGFLLNYLELAKAYYAIGEKKGAIQHLRMIPTLPDQTSDDSFIRTEASTLLATWTKQ